VPFAQNQGLEIFYEDSAQGPAVVLGHSFLCSGQMWRGQVPALAAGFRVINPDLRGHGRSGPAQGPFSLYDALSDALAVLDQLGIERATCSSRPPSLRSIVVPMPATWIVERTANRRFPYRVTIEQGGRLVLALRAQARWPGPGAQIFCLRERELDPAEPLELVERAGVAQLTRVGRKLTVTLDRGSRKRCEFLTVLKPAKDGRGHYEQIFFRTESGIRAHRSRSRIELRGTETAPVRVVIDSLERYPWRFPGALVERRKLATGDYALLDGERSVAVIERKSYDNLLGDFGMVQALHQQLADLASHPAAALVIEADYRDFLDPKRLGGRWPAPHAARVLAEIAALHPTLPVIYAGNRKLANLWTWRYFRAVAASREAREPELALEVGRRFDAGAREPGVDDQVRHAILHELPVPFAMTQLAERFPGESPVRLRRVLRQLVRAGRVARVGSGRGAKWARADGG